MRFCPFVSINFLINVSINVLIPVLIFAGLSRQECHAQAAKQASSKVTDATKPVGSPKAVQFLPDILVVRDGWKADTSTVKKVLESTAQELWKNFPNKKLPPIVVYPDKGPITLYSRGPNNEIFVRLDTGGTYWSQYAFQFSHEFCHILCEYDADPHGNNWFEESVCEMAALYSLRRMGETWKTAPPFDHWKSYAPSLTQYADNRIRNTKFAENETLGQWYKKNADVLAKDAFRRELNLKVAAHFLPLVEEKPEYWQAVQFINRAKPRARQSFSEYLSDWHFNCPLEYKPFVKRVAAEFEIKLTK